MKNLEPAQVAVVAYRDARQIQGMIAELNNQYESYASPEDDRFDGGKYAIGRLITRADSDFATDVLPKLQEAVYALVKFGDLLEVAAIAIGDNPDWAMTVKLELHKLEATATLFDKDDNGVA